MPTRPRALPLGPLLALLAGCGSAPQLPPGSDDGGADLAAPGAPDLGAAADLAPSGGEADLAGVRLVELKIGPISLQPGQERTVCVNYRLPTADAIDVVAIDGTLAPGSHHLIFYKSAAQTERTKITNCAPLDISKGDLPIFIAETRNNNAMRLPTGAAYHFEAGAMIKLEAHYLNATRDVIDGLGTIALAVGPPGDYQRADIMFCGSVSPFFTQGVPPGPSSFPPAFWKPPPGIKVFALTTHQHRRGSLMTVDKSTSTAPGKNLTLGQPYDNPPFPVWGDRDLVTFGPDEGFRWQCHYRNDDGRSYGFGQSAENDEMCFFWAYYFPSLGRFVSGECQL